MTVSYADLQTVLEYSGTAVLLGPREVVCYELAQDADGAYTPDVLRFVFPIGTDRYQRRSVDPFEVRADLEGPYRDHVLSPKGDAGEFPRANPAGYRTLWQLRRSRLKLQVRFPEAEGRISD